MENIKVAGNIYCAGVYGIRTKEMKDYLYIGSAIEINDALSRHKHNLKNNKYNKGNKKVLQDKFDEGEQLIFEVIWTSCFHSKNLNDEQKDALQEELSVIEEFYINFYRICCNCQKSVTKHSSNKDKLSTYKRQIANRGENNPHCTKLNKEKVKQIKIYQKNNTYNDKQLAEMYNVSLSHIRNIRDGNRWASVHIEDKSNVVSFGENTTGSNTVFGDTVNFNN
jgi:hypothetical protein